MTAPLTTLGERQTAASKTPLAAVPERLDGTAEALGLSPGVTQLLRSPLRELRTASPVQMRGWV